jgi:mannose-6-phosphate isomerase
LLLKFIDAKEPLSVQVHPDAGMAAEVETDGGKHEAWVVLASGDGGRLLLGTREGVTHVELAKVAHTAAVEGLLHAFRPEVGDAVNVPAGTVHAIGPELVLFEIQQNADVTYRLYDWGRDRETQVDKALAAAARGQESIGAVGVQQPEAIAGGGEWLLRTPHFRLRRFHASMPATLGTEGTFKIMTVIQGGGILGWRSGGVHRPLQLRAGDTALVPACTETVFLSPAGEWDFFWIDAGV